MFLGFRGVLVHTENSEKHMVLYSPRTNSNTDSSAKEKQEESTLSKTLKDLDINKAKLEVTDDVKEEDADFKKGTKSNRTGVRYGGVRVRLHFPI